MIHVRQVDCFFLLVFFMAFSQFVFKYWDTIPTIHGCFHKSYFEPFICLCESTALGHLVRRSLCKKQSK